ASLGDGLMQAWEFALERRTELEEWWRARHGERFGAAWDSNRTPTGQVVMPPIQTLEVLKLGVAAPFYVTEEMCDLLEHAGPTIPDPEFRREDLPLDFGFVLLARPLWVEDVYGVAYPWGAFSWGLSGAGDPDTAWGVHVGLYTRSEDDPDREKVEA